MKSSSVSALPNTRSFAPELTFAASLPLPASISITVVLLTSPLSDHDCAPPNSRLSAVTLTLTLTRWAHLYTAILCSEASTLVSSLALTPSPTCFQLGSHARLASRP